MKRTMIALMVSLFAVGITAMSAPVSFADETRKTTETKTDSSGEMKKMETETRTDADGKTIAAKQKTTETKTDFFGGAKRKTETEMKYDADGKTETRTETKTTK